MKKMLLKQAKTVYWEKWAAKHEWEELKEGVWLEPIQALLRRKSGEAWTDKHLTMKRKLVAEGAWVHKRLYDIGWADEVSGLELRGGHGQAQVVSLSVMQGSHRPDPRKAKGQHCEERLEVAERDTTHPLEEGNQEENPPDGAKV